MTFTKHLLSGVAMIALMANMATAQDTETTEDTATEAPVAEATEGENAENPAAASEEEAPTPTRDVDVDTVVATVNGQDITIGHMIVMVARLPAQYQQLPDDVLFEGVLDQLVQQIALAGDMNSELSKGSELALENERRGFLAGEAMRILAESAVTDEALQTLYDERFANIDPAQEFSAAHILVETEDEAKALLDELNGGADFATLAQEKSTGPSGPNGGDLGWFEKGMMVAPFEEAILAMKPGDLSGPVQTQFGWHVIKLNDVRQKEAPTLEEVRAELEQEVQQKAIEAAMAAAAEGADIARDAEGIDPAVVRKIELVEP